MHQKTQLPLCWRKKSMKPKHCVVWCIPADMYTVYVKTLKRLLKKLKQSTWLNSWFVVMDHFVIWTQFVLMIFSGVSFYTLQTHMCHPCLHENNEGNIRKGHVKSLQLFFRLLLIWGLRSRAFGPYILIWQRINARCPSWCILPILSSLGTGTGS